jgi:hypothetical protein
MKLLQAVDEGDETEICTKFGIPNPTLSTIIKNREKIVKITKLTSSKRIEKSEGGELCKYRGCMVQTNKVPECSSLRSTFDGEG